jgi:hypothetical protein
MSEFATSIAQVLGLVELLADTRRPQRFRFEAGATSLKLVVGF